jgi:di/tripeptidase
MRKSWTCVWSISTAAPCVTPFRVKLSPPSPSRPKSRCAESAGRHLSGHPEKRTGGERENLVLLLESVANDKAALTAQSRDGFVRLLNATPNGVIRNSDVAKGVVETSLNVGVVTMTDDNVEIHCLIRSLIDSGKDYVVSMLDSLGKLAGAKTEAKGAYPAGSRTRTRR